MELGERISVDCYSTQRAAAGLPYPDSQANKYTRGKLVIVAGSKRFPGAVCLAAAASQRAGAGYTEVVTHAAALPLVQAYRPSLVVSAFEDWRPVNLASVREGHPVAVVVGCGFDARCEENDKHVCAALRHAACPVLVDGSGLASLVSLEARLLLEERAEAGRATIITPHGGEAARLAAVFGIDTADSAKLALELAQAYCCMVVLKGPDTYISDGERVFVVQEGSAALAKAGTGDVLAGIVGALLAQGKDPLDACAVGVMAHALAGACAAEDLTDIAVTAEDVIDYLPAAWKHLAAVQ